MTVYRVDVILCSDHEGSLGFSCVLSLIYGLEDFMIKIYAPTSGVSSPSRSVSLWLHPLIPLAPQWESQPSPSNAFCTLGDAGSKYNI